MSTEPEQQDQEPLPIQHVQTVELLQEAHSGQYRATVTEAVRAAGLNEGATFQFKPYEIEELGVLPALGASADENAPRDRYTRTATTDGKASIRLTLPTEVVEALESQAGREHDSEHPLAQAVVEGARDRDVAVEAPEDFENVPGMGVRASTDHGEVLVGNTGLMERDGVDVTPAESVRRDLESEGKTAMLAAVDGRVVGVLGVADEVKASAERAVRSLRDRGVSVRMLTGDNERTARAVAERVGIDPDLVLAEVLPAEKANVVEDLQADGERVMMVGDGVNDAPALATAYVGCAIGSGTDVAIEAADVTLMRDDPVDVLKAIRTSEATLAKIKQNLVWALGYNTTMIPLASIGLLQPVLAAAAMAASSVSVLANSLAFRTYDPDDDYELLGFFRPRALSSRR